MNIRMLDFPAKGDPRGLLVALEGGLNIPFEIRRVYYIYATQSGVERGLHAHKTLQQVAVCVHGSCDFRLRDGSDDVGVHLSSPEKGLYIGEMVWREMSNFSSDCVLMVLASEHYNETDYIRNYDAFLALRNGPVSRS